MSINWVMLDQSKGFIHLPNERRIWASPPRTSLSITSPRSYPGNNPTDIQSSSGTVYLTNQRVVYLPSTPSQIFQSFSAPLTNLHDTHVTAPWFGPNVWYAVLQPVANGGLNTGSAHIEVKITFKEGGAYDFQTQFERLKERLTQAVEEARERNLMNGGRGTGQMDMGNVNLEELPAYEAASSQETPTNNTISNDSSLGSSIALGPGGHRLPPSFNNNPTDSQQPQVPTQSSDHHQQTPQQPTNSSTESQSFQPPAEPPPGYEEAQQQSVTEEFERRLSGGR